MFPKRSLGIEEAPLKIKIFINSFLMGEICLAIKKVRF